MVFPRVFLAALLCAACTPASPVPASRKALPELVPFVDTNPDPDVVEVSLVVAEGMVEYLPNRAANVWGYRDASANGSPLRVPGPLIDAKQGDLVIVHARNDLPKDGTSIHFHGIRLSSDMDGAHHAMLPGEVWEQRFVAKDAGLFWYHPHIRADVQIERGLHGPLVVRENEASRAPGDRILVLDDVKLDANGDLPEEWTEDDILHGRQGNVLLVNGASNPELRVTAGSRERWRLVNTSNGRIFNLALDKHVFTVIGWDGGRLGNSYEAKTLVISPGERYDVVVDITGKVGDSFALRTGVHDADDAIESAETLLTMAIENGPSGQCGSWAGPRHHAAPYLCRDSRAFVRLGTGPRKTLRAALYD